MGKEDRAREGEAGTGLGIWKEGKRAKRGETRVDSVASGEREVVRGRWVLRAQCTCLGYRIAN